jgi:hypothetical protein
MYCLEREMMMQLGFLRRKPQFQIKFPVESHVNTTDSYQSLRESLQTNVKIFKCHFDQFLNDEYIFRLIMSPSGVTIEWTFITSKNKGFNRLNCHFFYCDI